MPRMVGSGAPAVNWAQLRAQAIDLEAMPAAAQQAGSVAWPSPEEWAQMTPQEQWRLAKRLLPRAEYRRQARARWVGALAVLLGAHPETT